MKIDKLCQAPNPLQVSPYLKNSIFFGGGLDQTQVSLASEDISVTIKPTSEVVKEAGENLMVVLYWEIIAVSLLNKTQWGQNVKLDKVPGQS